MVVPVGRFSPREALNYLMTRLAADPDQRHGAIDLALALECDPCALAQAGAVIATTNWTCRDYLARYTAARDRLAARQAGDHPPFPAAVTWQLSAERAGQLLPGGTPELLLALAARLDGHPVPGPLLSAPSVHAWLAQAGVPAAGAGITWEAASALEDCGLITIDISPVSPAAPDEPPNRCPRPGRATGTGPVASSTGGGRPSADLAQEAEPGQAAGLRSCADALKRTARDTLWPTGRCHPVLTAAGHSLDTAD